MGQSRPQQPGQEDAQREPGKPEPAQREPGKPAPAQRDPGKGAPERRAPGEGGPEVSDPPSDVPGYSDPTPPPVKARIVDPNDLNNYVRDETSERLYQIREPASSMSYRMHGAVGSRIVYM